MSEVKKIITSGSMSQDERELIVQYTDKDDYMTVCTFISKYNTKLKKLRGAELVKIYGYNKREYDNSDEYKYLDEEDRPFTETFVENGWEYKIDPRMLSFRNKPKDESEMTEEELTRKKARYEGSGERLMKARGLI